ncbi:flagellar hook-length control protein FliK [Burkholderia stagnalis]|uniref:flagellar hook-length control protein FliK n=1 Tax=Burkholderia stagnalis TaxID=1503054 RepID=UPI000F811991|nr:flagellar hook-length control protein FliK [Burkholderia stagnalis]
MTESVAAPRSRSNRPSSAKPRRRAAAAAGRAPARATLPPGRDAQAADTHRDERTLDLFGDPVLDAGERVQAVAREAVATDAAAVAEAADDAHAHQQAMLDGFDAPQTPVADVHAMGRQAAAMVEGDAVAVVDGAVAEAHGRAFDSGEVASGDTTAAGASYGAGSGAAADVDVESTAAPGVLVKDGLIDVNGHSTVGTATEATSDASAKDAPTGADGTVASIASVTQDREPPSDAAEIAAVGAVTKTAASRAAGTRSSTGAKRRASAATAREAATPTGPAVDDVTPAPSQPDIPADTSPAVPAAPAITETPSTSRPTASVASIVTKPSSDRVEPSLAAQPDDASAAAAPAFDPDAHLRPLSERLAALQAETTALHRAADREMRRVNRLLLALAVVVLAGLAALVLQTLQVSRLKQEAATQQQRIDRLKADLTTQQATVMTLEQHNDMLMTQVNRLERSVSRQAPTPKPVAAKHGRRGVK